MESIKYLSQLKQLKSDTLDEARPEAVNKQHSKGRMTARERIHHLVDADSFYEYGQLVTPRKRSLSGVADGLVMGTGRVAGQPLCVMAYDYTVHGGTQSENNHRKSDRLLDLAIQNRWPLICWSEGGGARTQEMGIGSDCYTFALLAKLAALAPTVAIVTGPAFAGHANLVGVSELVIATRAATLGIAGPPLVSAAIGKTISAAELGPAELHARSGVVDILCADESEAIAAAQQYLSYFRPSDRPVVEPDCSVMKEIAASPPNMAYNITRVIECVADVGSILELRADFGRAVVTTLCRINGCSVGIIGNQPNHMAGAIDSNCADKIARFISLCSAYQLPVVFLCDTPGFMVGPGSEASALIRHSGRVLIALANAKIPILSVVLRKAYGLAYYIMGSAAFKPDLHIAWPTAEFAGMGLPGAVNILHKETLQAIENEAERTRVRNKLVDEMRDDFSALNMAREFCFDDIIDPTDTRSVLASVLSGIRELNAGSGKRHAVDAW